MVVRFGGVITPLLPRLLDIGPTDLDVIQHGRI